MAQINWIRASLRGRLGEIVGSSWKGIEYVKNFKPPGNPRTPDQVAVRSVFSRTVHIAKSINRTVLKPYTFPRPVKMSPYNRMIKINQPMFADLEWDPAKLKIFDGPMFTPAIIGASVVLGGLSAPAGIFINIQAYKGSEEDIIVGAVYDEATGTVLSAWSDAAEREGGLIDGILIPAGAFSESLNASNLHAYAALAAPPREGGGDPGQVSGTAYFFKPALKSAPPEE